MSISVEVENTCTCQYCEQCECSYSYIPTDECPECQAEMKESDCYGDCYNDAKEAALSYIMDWADFHKVDSWAIRYEGMTWERKSGTTYPISGLEETFDALTVNGDYRLVFILDNGTLKVLRYSHDEPMGASFTFIAERETVNA